MKTLDALSALQAAAKGAPVGRLNAALTRHGGRWWLVAGWGRTLAIAADVAGIDVSIPDTCARFFDAEKVARCLRELKPRAHERLAVTVEHDMLTWRFGDCVVSLSHESIRLADIESHETRGRLAHLPGLLMHTVPQAETVCRFEAGVLPSVYRTLKPAISTEETRYYLNGIYVEPDGFTATDGHKLVHVDRPVAGLGKPFILAREVLQLIMRPGIVGAWQDHPVEVRRYSHGDGKGNEIIGWRYFVTPDVICGPCNIQEDAAYPDWRRVVPEREKLEIRVTITTKALLAALASLGADRKYPKGRRRPIGLRTHKATVAVGHEGNILAIPATTNIPQDRDGLTIGLDAAYVRDLARALDPRAKGTLTFLMQDASGPLRIEASESNALVVLMPMRIHEPAVFGGKETAA